MIKYLELLRALCASVGGDAPGVTHLPSGRCPGYNASLPHHREAHFFKDLFIYLFY